MRYFELYEDNTQNTKKEIKSLLDKYSSMNILKSLSNRVSAWFKRNFGGKQPVSEDMNLIKSQLYKMIDQINDPIELQSILTTLKKDVILEKSRVLYLKKFGSTGLAQDRWFAGLILNANTNFDDKEKFLDELINNEGLFNGNKLLSTQIGSFNSLIQSNNPVYNEIKEPLLVHQGQLGFGPNQGPMEMFLTLLGKGVSFAQKGDLDVNGKILELKASKKSKGGSVVGGRPVGTSGYGNPAALKDRVYDKLRSFGVSEETLEEGSVNLNPKGLKNINDAILQNNVKPENTKELLSLIFNGLLTKLEENTLSRIYKSIESDGTINIHEFFKQQAVIQFIYYKEIEGYDYIMIANSDSTNYVLIDDEQDAEELYDKGAYKLSALINWNESRGGTAATQVIVK